VCKRISKSQQGEKEEGRIAREAGKAREIFKYPPGPSKRNSAYVSEKDKGALGLTGEEKGRRQKRDGGGGVGTRVRVPDSVSALRIIG